jgi:hypothetical protein
MDAKSNVDATLVILPSVISAVSGLVGVVVGGGLTAWRESRARSGQLRKDAEYLAILVSSRLDAYVSGWASVAGDDGLNEGQRNKVGALEVQEPTPKFEANDLDVNWRSLPVELMAAVLELPHRADTAIRELRATYEYSGQESEDEYFVDRRRMAAQIGLEVAALNAKLRAHVSLPPRLATEFDSVAYLREVREQLAAPSGRRPT